jgi:2-haloacid dehalogenase
MTMDIRALTFDTGDTLLNWHGGLLSAFEKAGRAHGLGDRSWAETVNEYRRRSLKRMVGAIDPPFNIDDVHREELAKLVGEMNLPFGAEEMTQISNAWHSLDAWPDVAGGLSRLRRRYSVVASTIPSVSLVIDASRKNRMDWDCILSCELLRVYKTNKEAYDMAAEKLALQPRQIMMVACHNFDLMAARAAGYRSAFVRRPSEWGVAGPPDPTPHPEHDVVATDLEDLAQQLGA